MLEIKRVYIGLKYVSTIEDESDSEFAPFMLDEWSTYPYYIAMDYRDIELCLDAMGCLDSELL